jgi:ketosteroid isomerase-like protein
LSTTTTAPVAASVAQADSSVERWLAGFSEGWRAPRGPEAFAAHFRPMLAPDVRLIQPQLPEIVGIEAFEQQFVKPLFALFADIRGDVERWAAREDALYIELTLRATLAGRPVSLRVCDRVTLKDGVAVERESYFDPAPVIAAIARTPSTWPTFLRLRLRRLTNHLTKRSKP